MAAILAAILQILATVGTAYMVIYLFELLLEAICTAMQ